MLRNECCVGYWKAGAADLICTIELLAVKHRKNLPLNKSEEFFFGKWRDLKKNYLAPLRRLAL